MEPIARLEPKPLDPVPTRRWDTGDLPHDGHNEREYLMKEKINNWKRKTILRSRTISTIIVTILGFVIVNMLGVDVNLGSFVAAADGIQLGELILAVGAVVAGFFRKNAKADLSKPSD